MARKKEQPEGKRARFYQQLTRNDEGERSEGKIDFLNRKELEDANCPRLRIRWHLEGRRGEEKTKLVCRQNKTNKGRGIEITRERDLVKFDLMSVEEKSRIKREGKVKGEENRALATDILTNGYDSSRNVQYDERANGRNEREVNVGRVNRKKRNARKWKRARKKVKGWDTLKEGKRKTARGSLRLLAIYRWDVTVDRDRGT